MDREKLSLAWAHAQEILDICSSLDFNDTKASFNDIEAEAHKIVALLEQLQQEAGE